MSHDNAASRLLQLLNKAKEIEQNISSLDAWGKLLGTRDPAKLLSRMGKMIALPEQISATLSNSVNTSPAVLHHISSQFYHAFTTHKFSEKWNEFTNRIDSHVINYLGLASTLLETQTKTKQLTEGELQELRDSFSDILERARNSDLPPRLKAYVVLQLHDIIATLDDYFITGAEPVLERIEATLGHAYVDEEYKNFLKDNELGKAILDCLGAAANVVTIAVGIPQLAQTFLMLQQGL